MHCIQNSASFDWVAFSALLVAVVSLGIGVYFNRRTLLLTEAHNKKTVEPLICDYYLSNVITEQNKNSIITYQVKNCGLGPAIIKSYFFEIDKKHFTIFFDLYREYAGEQKYLTDPSTIFLLESFHVLSPDESLVLFDLHFSDMNSALEFHALVKRLKFSLEYESIYGDKKLLRKERLSVL